MYDKLLQRLGGEKRKDIVLRCLYQTWNGLESLESRLWLVKDMYYKSYNNYPNNKYLTTQITKILISKCKRKKGIIKKINKPQTNQKEEKRGQTTNKTYIKITDLTVTISIIKLNINGLNSPN